MNTAEPEATSIHDISLQLANLRAHWLAWGGSDSIHEDLIVYRSGLQHGLLNGVLRLSGRSVREAAADAERQLANLPWRWWVGPDSDAGVAEALRERGYSPQRQHANHGSPTRPVV